MSVLDLIRRQDTSNAALDSRELVARYQRLRRVCEDLNSAMVGRLARDVLHEGGRKLGLLRGDTFVFDSEDETAVLMDYCLYHVRRNGRNAVEQYCCDHPAVPGTDEAICLRDAEHDLLAVSRGRGRAGRGAGGDGSGDRRAVSPRGYRTVANGQARPPAFLSLDVVRGLCRNHRRGHSSGASPG